MARFNSAAAVRGVAQAKVAFAAIEPIMRDKLCDATEETVRVIAFVAEAKVRRRFGILADHIRWSISRKTGVGTVGIGPRELVKLPNGRGTESTTQIGHLIEFGHGGPHPAAAFAFMIPAAEGEKANYLTRCQHAGADAERAIAATGGGLL